jgi:signal recognition particle receptor subunit beta
VLSVTAAKLLIAGGFGVGKTTMVGSVSEIEPLSTEETLTEVGQHVDDVAGVERKTTTTVVPDFGRPRDQTRQDCFRRCRSTIRRIRRTDGRARSGPTR